MGGCRTNATAPNNYFYRGEEKQIGMDVSLGQVLHGVEETELIQIIIFQIWKYFFEKDIMKGKYEECVYEL